MPAAGAPGPTTRQVGNGSVLPSSMSDRWSTLRAGVQLQRRLSMSVQCLRHGRDYFITARLHRDQERPDAQIRAMVLSVSSRTFSGPRPRSAPAYGHSQAE